jgi:hypothetical protein
MQILFPSVFGSPDPDFHAEIEAAKLVGFNVAYYEHDELVKGRGLTVKGLRQGSTMLRGWMMQPETYDQFYNELKKSDIVLINDPKMYSTMHLFPNAYKFLPSALHTLFYEGIEPNIQEVLETFTAWNKVFIKDYVKSVPEHNCIEQWCTVEQAKEVCDKFLAARGKLFTKGFVFKPWVEIDEEEDKRIEYRLFYYQGRLLSATPIHGAFKNVVHELPHEIVHNEANKLPSNFYTVDIMRSNKVWRVMECGDGGVSGLTVDQFPLSFYAELKNRTK